MRFAAEEAIVPLLLRAQSKGKTVFTVDYALKPANVADAVRTSRRFDFIPFVGARSLKNTVSVPYRH
jgi:endo-alpha-1,4-polygalactosaminidase (GH114 family)